MDKQGQTAEGVVRAGMAPALTVAVTQLSPAMADKAENLEKAEGYIEKAAEKRADIIVFPELYLTGYTCGEKEGLFYELAEPIPGTTTDTLIKMAKKNDIYIVLGMPEANTEYPGLIHNSAVFLGPEGVVQVFRKVHNPTFLPCKEILYGFAPGDEFPVFRIKQNWNIGMLICYDTWFPEAPRSLTVQGADILITISAGPSEFKDGWYLVNQVRSIENTVFHVYSNIVGTEWGDISFFGGAMIISPKGTFIEKGPVDKEDMIIATLNAKELFEARRSTPFLRDRRPSAYQELTDLTYPHM
jgi:N-carbamoylputrescine amidase